MARTLEAISKPPRATPIRVGPKQTTLASAAPSGVLPRVALLFALALLLRLGGLAFSLPAVFHPDEPTSIQESLNLLRGATDALSFANPPLYKYLLTAIFSIVFGNPAVLQTDPSLLFLIARAMSAIFGALTILPIAWIAHQMRGPRAGLIAAGLASTAFLLVRESHFAVNDALACLCTALALAAIVRVATRGTRADYLLAGVGLGLAFAAKYQCAAVLLPLLLAHVAHGRVRRDRDLLLGLAMAAVVAVIAFPPLVTETRRVVADVYVFLMLPSRLGFEGMDPAGGYLFYLESLGWDLGWPLTAVGALSIGWALVRREWPLIALASLPVALYVLMGSSHMYVARFLLPAMPAVIALSAILLSDLCGRSRPLAVALTTVALLGAAPSVLQFDTLLMQPDTRTDARAWVAVNVPPGASVLVDPPPFGPSLDGLPMRVLTPSSQAMYDTPLAAGIAYVVTSSFVSDAPNLDPARAARRQAFYATLAQEAELVAVFAPSDAHGFVYDRIYAPIDALDRSRQPGPELRIYHLRHV